MSRRILRMRVENFLSIGEAEFDFSDAGFVLVEGENGAGKSTIVDALLWCLFGETLRGYKYDDVVNRRVDKDCVVTVDFAVPGEDEYRVGRARRHSRHKNSLWLSTQGADVSGASEKDTQAEVERVLGCTYKTFLSSVVFGQDRAYRFGSLTDAEQKQILDEVLGVERFAAACAAARKRVSAVQSELDANRRALAKAEEARDEAETEAADLQVKHVDFEGIQRKKVAAEREKLRAVKEQINKTRKIFDVDKLKTTINDLLSHLATLEKKVEKKTDEDAVAQLAMSSSKAKFDLTDTELKRRQRSSPIKCPTCGQKIMAKAGSDVITELRGQWETLKDELADATRVASRTARVLSEDKLHLKELREEMTSVQKALNDGITAEASMKSWRQQARTHEARIAELEAEVSPYAELADKARARYEKYETEAQGIDALITQSLEPRLQYAKFWVNAFGNAGLRSLLIDSSLPLLNEEAARVSRVLTGGEISIEFSATSEQKSGKTVDRFEVRVDNRHGAGDYAGNSAGERAKVDLCVGLALQRLVASRSSASFNLAIFDEVFDHLSTAAHEPVVEVLSELDKESVLVISHDDDLKAWFPATWRMVKKNGLSTIES